MKSDLLYGIVANSKTRVRCIYCGVFIPKAKKCIEQHTNGAKHKDSISLMADNGITFTNDGLFCKPCKLTFIEEDSIMNHIGSDDHANWIAAMEDLIDGEFINLEDYLTSDNDEIYCQACDTNISGSLAGVQEHVNQFIHRSKITDRLKPLHGIFSVNTDEEVWCKLCNVYIENTIQDILYHIDDDEQHTVWLMEVEDLIDDHDISIKNYLSNEHEHNAFCNKCHIEIPCNVISLEDHISSQSHLQKITL